MKKLITIALSLLLLPFLAQSQPLPNTLTPDQKAYELSLIWREMAYNFDNMDHCAEVDADSLYRAFVPVVRATEDDYAYSKAIMRYLASFQNSHTYVVDAPWLVAPLAQPYIRTEYRDGKLFLTNFASKYADRMRVGDEVVSINGMDAVTYMRENMLPYVPATNDDHRLQIAMSFMGLWTLFPYGTMFDLTLKGDTLYQLSLPAEKLVDDPSNDWYVNDYERNKENICYIDHASGTGYLRLTDCFETGKQFFLQHKDSLSRMVSIEAASGQKHRFLWGEDLRRHGQPLPAQSTVGDDCPFQHLAHLRPRRHRDLLRFRPRHPDGFLGLLQGDHRRGAVSEACGEDRG